MAKLPEIKYSIGVQSLGREDINAPGRLASARINSARQIAQAGASLENTIAAGEYTKAMSQSRTSISDLYDTVVSKEAFASSEIPEYVTGFDRYETSVGPDGQEIIRERIIPASEVRAKWFEQGLKNITNTAVQSTRTPTARNRVSQEMRTSIGPAAYNQLLTYNRAAIKQEQLAILDSTVQEAIVNGDRIGVEATLARYYASGLISAKDYETRQLAASQNLDIEAYSQDIFNSADEADLEELYTQLGDNESLTKPGDSDMTPEQRRYLRQSIDRQEAVFEEERKDRHDRNDQVGMSLFFEGSLSHGWLNDMAINDGLSASSLRSLKNMLDTGGRGQSIRDTVMSPFRTQIQDRMYTPNFGQQMSDVVRDVQTGLRGSEVLNPEEKRSLIEYSQTIQTQLRATPEIKTALTSIRSLTGLPEDPESLSNIEFAMDPVTILARQANADFQRSLYNYIDEFGAEAKPLEFVDRNKDRFDYINKPERRDSVKLKMQNSRFSGYMQSPTVTPKAVLRHVYRDYKRGKVSEEDMFDLWNMIYGDAVDIGLLESM